MNKQASTSTRHADCQAWEHGSPTQKESPLSSPQREGERGRGSTRARPRDWPAWAFRGRSASALREGNTAAVFDGAEMQMGGLPGDAGGYRAGVRVGGLGSFFSPDR